MILIISSTFPLLLIAYFFYITKKRESIEFEVRRGIYCYSCGSVIRNKDDYYEDLYKGILNQSDDNYKQCVSCNRNDKINQINSPLRYKIFSNINRFFLSKKFINLSTVLIFLMILFILIYILSIIIGQNNRLFILMSNFTNFIFWLFAIKRYKIFTIKKPAK